MVLSTEIVELDLNYKFMYIFDDSIAVGKFFWLIYNFNTIPYVHSLGTCMSRSSHVLLSCRLEVMDCLLKLGNWWWNNLAASSLDDKEVNVAGYIFTEKTDVTM